MALILVALVGMKHRGTEALVASLPQGEPLTLVREPTNQYDRNAVQVWARGKHIGYCKASQNRAISMAMDTAAAKANVNVTSLMKPAKLAIDGGKWPMVEIDE